MSTLREFGLEVLHFKRIICFARIIVPSTFYFSVVVVTTITTVSEITEYRIRRFFPLFFFERNIEHFYRTIIKPYAKVVFIVNGTKKERNLLTDYVTFDRVFYLIFCSMEILVYLNKDTFMQNIHMPARNGTGCFGSFNERWCHIGFCRITDK